jgi:hypothetical protein
LTPYCGRNDVTPACTEYSATRRSVYVASAEGAYYRPVFEYAVGPMVGPPQPVITTAVAAHGCCMLISDTV